MKYNISGDFFDSKLLIFVPQVGAEQLCRHTGEELALSFAETSDRRAKRFQLRRL